MGRLGALARIAATSGSRSQALLDGPILPTLVTLALPNILALGVQSIVAIAETSYLGRIGTEALAAMALVFPMIMLTQMMSSGAIGGGVSSAISRELQVLEFRIKIFDIELCFGIYPKSDAQSWHAAYAHGNFGQLRL